MEKLKLDVEALRIESFATDSADEGRGTVIAASENATVYCGLTSLKYYLCGTWMQQK